MNVEVDVNIWVIRGFMDYTREDCERTANILKE